jgi:hypothetical protein
MAKDVKLVTNHCTTNIGTQRNISPIPTGIHVEIYEEKDQAAKFMVHSIITNPFNYVQVNVKEQISKLHHNKPIRRRAS